MADRAAAHQQGKQPSDDQVALASQGVRQGVAEGPHRLHRTTVEASCRST
jgi:hypothetical protein